MSVCGKHLTQQFEIHHIFPNRSGELMAIDQASAENTRNVAFPSDSKEIVILTEQHALRRGRTDQAAAHLQNGGSHLLEP